MSDFITVTTFLPFEPELVDWPIGVQLVILFSFRFLLAHFDHKLTVRAYSLPMVRHSSASVRLSDRQAFQRASSHKNRLVYQSQILCVGEQNFIPGIWVTWPNWLPRLSIIG